MFAPSFTWVIEAQRVGAAVGAGGAVRGWRASGFPPGFHSGFQSALASHWMGSTMEAMAVVMWGKLMVRSSSEGL